MKLASKIAWEKKNNGLWKCRVGEGPEGPQNVIILIINLIHKLVIIAKDIYTLTDEISLFSLMDLYINKCDN